METIEKKAGVAGKEAVDMPLFTFVKDGNGFELKLANLDHPNWAPFEGIVQIESTKINKHGPRNHNVKIVRDRNLGCIFGVPLGVDNFSKNIRWQGFILRELNYYDLSIPEERKQYIVVSRSPYMENSPNQKGVPVYKVIDHNKKAENVLQQFSERKRALSIYENLTFEQIVELSHGFGINPNAHSQLALQAELCKIAVERHIDFLKVWDDPNRKGMVTFKRAQKIGMIKFDAASGGWFYDGIALGNTEASAYAALSSNVPLLTTMEMIIKSREGVSKHDVKVAPEVVAPKEESDKIIHSQAATIEELQKRIAELQSKNTSEPEEKTDDPERKELIDEARSLGIKGAHLYKDISKLKEDIEKVKNK